MIDLDTIGEDLFNKIRGRFPNVTIGDNEGTITNEPSKARFFDFDYKAGERNIGKVSVSISEDDGLSIIYSRDFISNEDELTQKEWYNFLKELRQFAKKRLLNFDVRDVNKSNLNKRDYKFLANRSRDGQMTESKLYGTSRISYQKVGEARIVIKHTESINQESVTGRTQKIGKIYIESADGERFRYPYKHLSGARAMARHVAEGGNAYDDFGKHIVGLSEEMGKLRKFKNYMGRSAVMAESLAGYVDIVKERISTVKKTIESLHKPAYYAETFAAFETPVMEDVPSDVAENWIDELTIKQFNEELQDIFPYIYNLVKEGTKAKELGPDDLEEVAGPDKCWDGYKKAGTQPGTGKNKGKRVNKCVPEEIALEQGFEEMMGQFAEAKECEECNCAPCECDTNEDDVQEAYINTSKDAVDVLGALRGKGKAIERGQDDDQGNLANQYVTDVWDVYSFIEARTNGFSGLDKNAKAAIDAMMKLRGEAKKLETKPGSGKNARFGNAIVTVLYPVMEYLNTTDFDRNKKEDDTNKGIDAMKKAGNAKADAEAKDRKASMKKKGGNPFKKTDGDEITLEKDDKTPLGEFILSYYDRETGKFPKGETAVLTMVEKDYGEQFIEPAKAFIESVNQTFEAFEKSKSHIEDSEEYNRMKELAGLR